MTTGTSLVLTMLTALTGVAKFAVDVVVTVTKEAVAASDIVVDSQRYMVIKMQRLPIWDGEERWVQL
jgi:hypothetical protein